MAHTLNLQKTKIKNVKNLEFPNKSTAVIIFPMPQRTSKKLKKADNEDVTSSDIPEPVVKENILLNLTTHTNNFDSNPLPLSWGHPDPAKRGPILCTIRHQVSNYLC